MRKAWSVADEQVLREWYSDRRGKPLAIDALCVQLNRKRGEISRHAGKLGLSDRKRPRPDLSAKLRAGASGWTAGKGPHPRGMQGKTHTPEVCQRLSLKSRERVASGTHVGQRIRTNADRERQSSVALQSLRGGTGVYSRCKHGKREDLGGQFFRSSWEANYARFLNLLIQQGQIRSWKYEADTFWFEKIRRGVRSYTPDFKITDRDGTIYYVEVKGWMDPKSKTKLKRMKKYHSSVDLRLVDQKAYREIDRKLGGAIPNWERAA